MLISEADIGEGVRKYCAEIGLDPLLVQGAGGNASWKEGDILWIKASGTWLANAKTEDIFIPVDLISLKSEIAKQNFSAIPDVISDVKLRPSIETILHALMPHRVVLHLHAIEALVHLVRPHCRDVIEDLFRKFIPFALVDYFKPGADLASEIHTVLARKTVDVIFLKNHGLVIGGENISKVRLLLSTITDFLATEPLLKISQSIIIPNPPKNFSGQYAPVADQFVQQLALDPNLFLRLSSDWALYPDHVVFLGPRAYAYQSWTELEVESIQSGPLPELIFLSGVGVYAKSTFTKAKLVQLRCYLDIMVRQKIDSSLICLTLNQIGDLLNWDAEQYRISLAN